MSRGKMRGHTYAHFGHCFLPGHGTRCVVGSGWEPRTKVDMVRSAEKRFWRREVLADGVGLPRDTEGQP